MRVAVNRGVKYITDNANSLTLGAHGVGGVVQACELAIESIVIPSKWLQS